MVGSLFSNRPLETISSGNVPCRIFDPGLRYGLRFCWASSCCFFSGPSSGGGGTKREGGRVGGFFSMNWLSNADASTVSLAVLFDVTPFPSRNTRSEERRVGKE